MAYLLLGMWNLPGPGIEPVSPALAGGFYNTDQATGEAPKFTLVKCTMQRFFFKCIHKVVQLLLFSNSKKFSSFPKETLYPLAVTPHSPGNNH